MRYIGLVLGSLLALACSAAPPDIHATSYNQSCFMSSDCVLISEGSGCCNSCSNAAINQSDLAKYQSDIAPRKDACTGTSCPALACVFSAAYCSAGTCAVCHNQSGC
jgi:hypothetical protein